MKYPTPKSIAHFLGEATAGYATKPAFIDAEEKVFLYQDDCLNLMDRIIKKYPEGIFDMIFADPPYFLSNDGITCSGGKAVKVNKGKWDKSQGIQEDHNFNLTWLEKCQKLLKPNATLWVTGTQHNIFSVGLALQTLGYKILNKITWQKTNPPPNLSCRYFTHSTETLIWAAKNNSAKHHFNYEAMKAENNNKQMQSVWTFPAALKAEKVFGKHPTQKPLSLVSRCINASTQIGDFIFDPFTGSGTTGVAAKLLNRKFCGVEQDAKYINLAIQRLEFNNLL